MTINWHFPTEIIFGCGQLQQINFLCKELKISKPLIVTDESLSSTEFVKQLENFLKTQSQTF